MITGIHTGDEHLDDVTHSTYAGALNDNVTAFASVVNAAITHDVDFLIHAGDMFAHGRPNPETLLRARDTLAPYVRTGNPLILFDGNHEFIQHRHGYRTATSVLAAMLSELGEVHLVSGRGDLVRCSNGVQVVALPWMSKTQVLTERNIDVTDPAHGDREMTKYLVDAVEVAMNRADASAPLIFASHITAGGNRHVEVGSEKDMPTHLYSEPIMPLAFLEDLPSSYNGLSHIHTRQRLGSKTFYSGAPNRFSFTDATHGKSANLVQISDSNVLERVSMVHTAARSMQRLHLDSDDEIMPNAVIELTVPAGASIPNDVRTRIADAGSRVVKIITQRRDVERIASVQVAADATPREVLRTWVTSQRPGSDVEKIIAAAESLNDAN